ncbi:MAG: serine/threonine-protein kinase, partial [Kofleriaceae bacterium]
MSSCLRPDELAACARGELAEDARTAVELHIDGCATCRIALSEACRHAVSEARARSLPEPGEVVGRYTIEARLGEGGMGVVFAARDRELARDVAIKLLRPQLGASEDELVRERMLREGRTIARIDHPNVVRVLDVGEWRGSRFVVMERLSGVTLRAWLETKPSPAAIREVMVQCARGLAAAHAVDVVHRDFKPDNVIVDPDGHVRVADFGLAAEPGGVASETSDDQVNPRLTRTHGALGTPAYMSPEQRRGEPVDARADQYAWCVVAVEALPLEAWPRRARRALHRGLAQEPAQRWSSFAELLALAAPRRGLRWVLAGTAVLALGLAVVAIGHGEGDSCAVDLGWAGPREARAAMAFTASESAGAPAAWRYVDGAVARYETS